MNLQNLTYIVEIEKCGSISKAAQNLFVSQPYLSRVVKEIENEFKVTLFTRSKSGIALTENGRIFVDMSKELLGTIDNFHAVFAEHIESSRLRVTAGIGSHASDTFVRMVQENPHERLRCTFRETTYNGVISDVYNNEADVGVMLVSRPRWQSVQSMLQTRHIEYHELFASSMYLLARKDHPLVASGKPFTIEDLYQYNFVLYEAVHNARTHMLESIYSDTPLDVVDWSCIKQVVWVTNRAALRDLLLRTDYLGIGVADVREQEDHMNLVTFPLPPRMAEVSQGDEFIFCYIHLKNRELPPAARAYIRCLKKYYGDML